MKQTQAIKISNKNRGFTLIEIIVGLAIAGILLAGAIGAYTALTRNVKLVREKTILTSLSNNYLEVVRNLPYSQVGTIVGNPTGSLPDLTNAATVTIESTAYKIYYEVTYVDDPADGLAPTDVAPADYKQVKLSIKNLATTVVTNFLTNVSPKGLEGTSNAGALLIKVFDAVGQPVAGAGIHIQKTDNSIILDRTGDSAGNWIEVGLPPAVNGYHIVVAKSAYSTDQTYSITAPNPNPIKTDATTLVGQITQVSFAIDLLSNLAIKTLDQTCQNLSAINVNVSGAKLIGTNPNVLKFNNNYSSSGGQIALNNIEWDAYTPTLLTGQSYTVVGTSPIQQINVLPNTTQTFTIILGPASANSLLIIVKDAATKAPLENASAHLLNNDAPAENYTGITGGSVWVQVDWTGGGGQVQFTDKTRYFSDDANIDVTTVPTGIRLSKVLGNYAASGWLESSTFDTGGASSYTTLTWEPQSQDPATTLKFQIASNNDNTTWNYKGPDGTAAAYYTVSGMTINAVHNNDRYIRYKTFLSTADSLKTPVLTSININYVSGCFTPGQTFFTNLTAGNNFSLDVALTGYLTQIVNNLNINGNQALEILMSP